MAAIEHSLPLSPEPLFEIGGIGITNSIVTTWITIGVILLLGMVIRRGLMRNYQGVGGGLAILLEFFVDLLRDILGWSAAKQLTALLGTFLLFILVGNWLGLIPGVGAVFYRNDHGELIPLLRAATTDLHTTMALATLTVLATQIWGVKQQGIKYAQKFVNFGGPIFLKPINFFVGILEIISELAKILSFGFRLFGNIFAGEVLLTVMIGLIPFIVPTIFYGLELFVGFIQAFVFVMLSAVFMKMAGESHSEEHA